MRSRQPVTLLKSIKMSEPKVNTKVSIMQELEKIPAAQIPALPAVSDRFKQLYQVIHGKGAKVQAFFESEKYHFMRIINDNQKLSECTKLSLYGCFLDVAVNGLSFDPSFKHLYLVPFNHNAGTQAKPKWEQRAQLQISGYGELVLRIKQGQIKYADNPVLVYDTDPLFEHGTKDERGFVNHTAKLPTAKSKIIGCYLKITRSDNTVDYKIITLKDMERFKAYAKKDREGNLSKAWTDGEGGMWQSKCIKHAFKSYPKIRTGKFSQLETATVDAESEVLPGTMNIPETIDYSLSEGEHGNTEDIAHEEVDHNSNDGGAASSNEPPVDENFQGSRPASGSTIRKEIPNDEAF